MKSNRLRTLLKTFKKQLYLVLGDCEPQDLTPIEVQLKHTLECSDKWNSIYLVTSVRSDNADGRCWGWYPTEDSARHAVAINDGDMHELCYDYLVIEKKFEGTVTEAEEIAWFMWDSTTDKWVSTTKPSWTSDAYNWAF